MSLGRVGDRDVVVSGWIGAAAVGRIGDRDAIIAGGGDNAIRVWDAVSGALLRSIATVAKLSS